MAAGIVLAEVTSGAREEVGGKVEGLVQIEARDSDVGKAGDEPAEAGVDDTERKCGHGRRAVAGQGRGWGRGAFAEEGLRSSEDSGVHTAIGENPWNELWDDGVSRLVLEFSEPLCLI